MGCLKCLCIKKLKKCCGLFCSIFCCILGLGWSTFLMVMSGNYKMSRIWPALTLLWGLVVFLACLIALVMSMCELFRNYNCWRQGYSIDGNLNDLNAYAQQQESTVRYWNIYSSERNSYSMNSQLQADSATQHRCHDLSHSSVQLNSENNNENGTQPCCWTKSQTDHIQENIALESQGRFPTLDEKTGETSCRTTTMYSTRQQTANIESESNIPFLQTFVQTRTGDLHVENSSHHRNQLRWDINSNEMPEIHCEMQSATADLTNSSSSDNELHIYESINSSYEEEFTEPDYEYIEPLPPRRRQQNFLSNALDTPSGDAEMAYESSHGDDVQATTHVNESGESDHEVD